MNKSYQLICTIQLKSLHTLEYEDVMVYYSIREKKYKLKNISDRNLTQMDISLGYMLPEIRIREKIRLSTNAFLRDKKLNRILNI